MEESEEPRENRKMLKRWIDAAGYKAFRFGPACYCVGFHGDHRVWDINVSLDNGWVAYNTYVLKIPEQPGARAKLLERACEMNNAMSLTKLVKADNALSLEMEYRAEHVDSEVFARLICLMMANAEQYYPELFRLVTGDAALQELEDAFKRPSLSSGDA